MVHTLAMMMKIRFEDYAMPALSLSLSGPVCVHNFFQFNFFSYFRNLNFFLLQLWWILRNGNSIHLNITEGKPFSLKCFIFFHFYVKVWLATLSRMSSISALASTALILSLALCSSCKFKQSPMDFVPLNFPHSTPFDFYSLYCS